MLFNPLTIYKVWRGWKDGQQRQKKELADAKLRIQQVGAVMRRRERQLQMMRHELDQIRHNMSVKKRTMNKLKIKRQFLKFLSQKRKAARVANAELRNELRRNKMCIANSSMTLSQMRKDILSSIQCLHQSVQANTSEDSSYTDEEEEGTGSETDTKSAVELREEKEQEGEEHTPDDLEMETEEVELRTERSQLHLHTITQDAGSWELTELRAENREQTNVVQNANNNNIEQMADCKNTTMALLGPELKARFNAKINIQRTDQTPDLSRDVQAHSSDEANTEQCTEVIRKLNTVTKTPSLNPKLMKAVTSGDEMEEGAGQELFCNVQGFKKLVGELRSLVDIYCVVKKTSSGSSSSNGISCQDEEDDADDNNADGDGDDDDDIAADDDVATTGVSASNNCYNTAGNGDDDEADQIDDVDDAIAADVGGDGDDIASAVAAASQNEGQKRYQCKNSDDDDDAETMEPPRKKFRFHPSVKLEDGDRKINRMPCLGLAILLEDIPEEEEDDSTV